MLDLENEIRDSLAQLYPALDDLPGDWQAIKDAAASDPRTFAPVRWRRPLWRRRRIALLASILAVGLAIPLIAFATGDGWWFQRDQGPVPQPIGGKPTVIVAGHFRSGYSHNLPWTFLAYIPATQHIGIKVGGVVLPHTENLGICTALIVGKLSNQPEETTCGPLRGLAGNLKGAPAGGWFTEMHPNSPRLLVGAVASGVARLDLVSIDKTGATKTTVVPLLRVSAIGEGVRFYILHSPLPEGAQLVARNASGKTLGQQAAEHPFTIPMTKHA